MKKILFKGCGTAIATPFDENGVNLKEFERLLENQIQNKVDSIIVCGTTGEASTMTLQEKLSTIQTAVKISNGRIPIIAGTGGNNTKQVIEYSKEVEKLGVDGLLIVTPYYNKCTQNGLIEHYKMIAKNITLPIILYSVPGRTGVNIEPKTCLALSKIENIVAIKEASGNLSQVAEIAHLCGDNLSIYSGNDDQVLPILSLGGIGVISVLSNVMPEYTHTMVQKFLDGYIDIATKMQLDAIPLIKALFSEVNPIPVKAGLNLLGYNYGIPRLPLTKMTEEKESILKNELLNLMQK
ncbi:MAG: 4-hydroxy-tetrahydrodipicolinate synthase [Clostridia bacterium]|nr:4-hydroxy-tetrahydrodipicolinate synthase [Clostridia bacterium]